MGPTTSATSRERPSVAGFQVIFSGRFWVITEVYRIGNQLPDGGVVWISGEFELVESPHRLVYSWRVEDEPVSRVTVSFSAIMDGATEVVIRHERIHSTAVRDDHERGWQGCLDRLERWVV